MLCVMWMSGLLFSNYSSLLKEATYQLKTVSRSYSTTVLRMAERDDNTAEAILRQYSTDIEAQWVTRKSFIVLCIFICLFTGGEALTVGCHHGDQLQGTCWKKLKEKSSWVSIILNETRTPHMYTCMGLGKRVQIMCFTLSEPNSHILSRYDKKLW